MAAIGYTLDKVGGDDCFTGGDNARSRIVGVVEMVLDRERLLSNWTGTFADILRVRGPEIGPEGEEQSTATIVTHPSAATCHICFGPAASSIDNT